MGVNGYPSTYFWPYSEFIFCVFFSIVLQFVRYHDNIYMFCALFNYSFELFRLFYVG